MSEAQIKKEIRTILSECGVRSQDPERLRSRLLSFIKRQQERKNKTCPHINEGCTCCFVDL